jgi:hypothetical protein
MLRAGAVAQRLRWSEPRGVVDVAILLDQTPPVAVLSYEVDHVGRPTGPRVQRVDLVPVPWGFGGVRWHWVCPETGRLARKLYLPAGATRFLSRHAYGFTWRTHHTSPLARSHARLARIAKKLGAEYRAFTKEPPPRPKWMRWWTYERLVAEWEAAAGRHDAVWCAGAERILRRIGGV